MTTPLPHRLGLAQRAGRERRLKHLADEQPAPLRTETRRGSFFVPDDTARPTSTPISLTPLGAYLRLREGAAASFLLESVEKGRLGRAASSARARGSSRSRRPSSAVAAGRPVVGYLGYDHVAVLEPTVPLPDGGRRTSPRAGSSSPTRSSASTTRRASAEVLAGDRDEIAALLARPVDDAERRRPVAARRDARASRAARPVRGGGASRRRSTDPRGRRVPDRPLPARRAARPRSSPVGALPRAAPRQPLAVPLPPGARRTSRSSAPRPRRS